MPALPLDGFFALNPAMPNLHRLYKAGQAIVVHAVATPYREQVRHVIPNDVQDDIRRVCGDRTKRLSDGFNITDLPETCSLKLDPKKAAASAAALRAQRRATKLVNSREVIAAAHN